MYYMKYLNSLLIVIGIYIAVQSIGLYVGTNLIGGIESGEIPSAIENPESVKSSLQIFVYVLVMTGVLLLLIKFGFDLVIQVLMVLVVFCGASIAFFVFTDYGFIPAICLIILCFWKKENVLLKDITLIFAIAGIGAMLGSSLGVVPAMVLLIALSIYDIIAVFGTKHMVTLAEEGKGRFPFMFTVSIPGAGLELGTGDLAIPLMFSVSVLRDHSIYNAIIVAGGGLLGVIALFIYILGNRKRKVLPALPPIAAGLLLGLYTSFLIL